MSFEDKERSAPGLALAVLKRVKQEEPDEDSEATIARDAMEAVKAGDSEAFAGFMRAMIERALSEN